MSGVDDFVRQLPHGYETHLGSAIANLSMGQRQRIAIARAFLKEGRLIVLDEAMSGVDMAGRMQILDAIRKYLPARTGLLISHDPILISECDRICELANGKLVDRANGTPLTPFNASFYAASGLCNSSPRPAELTRLSAHEVS